MFATNGANYPFCTGKTMQINRPPSSASVQQSQTTTTDKITTPEIKGSALSSADNLKNQLTPRSHDYLSRLQAHGSLTEKSLASSVSRALDKGSFMENPVSEKPVSQFGVATILDGRKGILLANFMPHNDKLELEALAFREERFFESEVGNIQLVVMQNARHLPEVKAHQPGNDPTATASDSLKLQHTTGQNPEAEAKALDKDIKRFQNQTMHRQMASKLADSYVNKGDYKSRATALPAAHAAVLGAKARKLIMSPFQSNSGKSKAPEPVLSSAASAVVPRGPQFQFTKEEFSDFHDDHWMQNPANNPELTQEGTGSLTEAQSNHPSGSSSEAASPQLSGRRFGQVISDQMRSDLLQQLNDNASSSSTNSTPGSRRDAQVFDNQFIEKLNQQLKDSGAS
ncbi:hypothetical protein SD961_05680 [Erwinia sp. MMLR14_017]|uniref:hypothetical protein n=1 Tax=Erwinia sp. MMLR14_017 TaxID=3093842 RepID=UPI00299071B5|nr:hypothetical protein [Erwinia sp. MMLR14_017]MDW8845388.1 hypothetical protein [Erwinia sp. MMLR14_017]